MVLLLLIMKCWTPVLLVKRDLVDRSGLVLYILRARTASAPKMADVVRVQIIFVARWTKLILQVTIQYLARSSGASFDGKSFSPPIAKTDTFVRAFEVKTGSS